MVCDSQSVSTITVQLWTSLARLYLCAGRPLGPRAVRMMASGAFVIPSASRQHTGKGQTWEGENKKRVSGRNLRILGVRLCGLVGWLFSPWDLNVLLCRSCALITISSPDIPAAQLVGGFFPAMINYSLSESKSAFSSLIISDKFILLTWARIEAIDDNKLTLSILMTSLGDYG